MRNQFVEWPDRTQLLWVSLCNGHFESHLACNLNPFQQLNDFVELGISRMTSHPTYFVSQAIDGLHAELEQHIHRQAASTRNMMAPGGNGVIIVLMKSAPVIVGRSR